MRKYISILLTLVFILGMTACAKEEEVATVQPVTIKSASGFQGYGVPIGPNMVVTCWHICEKSAAKIDGYGSALLYRNEDEDIAVYKTKKTFEVYATIADSITGIVPVEKVDPGDSGLPVFNKAGLLVGLVAGIDSDGNPRYAFVSSAKKDINQVIISQGG